MPLTPEQVQTAAPILAASIFAFAMLLLLLSLRLFRKSRRDVYWRRRRAAGQRGWRLFVWSLGLILMSGVICVTTGIAGLLYNRATPSSPAIALVTSITKTAISTPAPTLILSLTLEPSLTVTVRLSATPLTPKATQTSSITLTPKPTSTSTSSQTSLPTATSTFTPSLTHTLSQTPLPTLTFAPTFTATFTSTFTPTVTATFTPRPTATLPLPSPTLFPTPTVLPVLPASTQTIVFTLPTATWTTTSIESKTPTDIPVATSTIMPISTPSMTPTVIPTSTSSSTPTITPTPTNSLVPFVSPLVLESDVTPGPDARITINAVDAQLSNTYGPVKGGNTFNAGFTRIYFFISFTGLQNGVLWRRELLLNDQVIQSSEHLWGPTQSGSAYFFFGQEDGFKHGTYQIRLYIGQRPDPEAVFSFTVN